MIVVALRFPQVQEKWPQGPVTVDACTTLLSHARSEVAEYAITISSEEEPVSHHREVQFTRIDPRCPATIQLGKD
jgi:hypothetical protein